MLSDFLLSNEKEILELTEKKSLELAGLRPSSEQLKKGLPVFYQQLMDMLRTKDISDVYVTKAAALHGTELMRLGYTLSHVVHAYGAMCQSITELAMIKKASITSQEFHDLNRFLDVAIAGAVTEFQSLQNNRNKSRELEHLDFLAHELRNALAGVTISIHLIKKGTVGFGGSTGLLLDRGLKRIEEIIDRSMMELRHNVDQKIHLESARLLQLVEQIMITEEIEASSKNQVLEIKIDPALTIEVDHQLFHSALSNLIQNAIRYTPDGGKIQVRGTQEGKNITIEVQDECGGLTNFSADLFKSLDLESHSRNGLGFGLTIAKRAIELSHGTIEVSNLPGSGCVFKIILPKGAGMNQPKS